MSVYTNPPEWEAQGKKPPSSKREEGWKPGDRVPASWLNWFWFSTVNSLREIAQAFINHRDASAPHDGHETKEGATAKVEAHSAKTTGVHGVGDGFYVAKTTRADQHVGWDDIVDKPAASPVRGVESGVASDGEYVALPFAKMPRVILQPFDMMVYSPDHSDQRQRIHVYPEDVSPQGFRVVAKTVLEAGEDVEHTFPKQQYQAPRFAPCQLTGHGTPGDLFSSESLYNVGDKVMYTTTHDDVTRVEVQVREMMHVHAYAGNYSATNRLSYRVRIRKAGATEWLRTFGPVERSRHVKSSLLTTDQRGSHNLQSIVFENLPADKYEIEIEITDKTIHSSNGDNRWNSCWLIVEKWIESRGEPIEAANPARVQWLAIETEEEG